MARLLQDLQGREAGLGRCLGRGGEGAVYSLPMRPRLVAKIYARSPDDQTTRKLGAMVQLGTEALATFAAWPQDLLLDPRTGSTVGFLMPRVDGHREIHKLYGPTDRKTAFPDAGWSFLVRASRNMAAAFDAVHKHGHVIGDVNQGNVIVSRKATVHLIDCDSFQITHLGHTYPCRVGVPLFTPPELQGKRLEGVVRTADHDRFGLAVLVFQLLFMGRHPFAGRHPQRALPLDAAIREGLFAFGAEAAQGGWQPPPFSLRLAEVPPSLAGLFERAFGREAAGGGARPTAAEWLTALEHVEATTVTCENDSRHGYAATNGSCPWCRIEGEGGPSFFYLPPGAAPDAFDPNATWQAIESVRPPGPALLPKPPELSGPVGPPAPPETTTGLFEGGLLGTARRRHLPLATALTLTAVVLLGSVVHAIWFGEVPGLLGLLGAIGAGTGLVAYLRARPGSEGKLPLRLDAAPWERYRREEAVAAAEEELRRLQSRWEHECGDAAFVSWRQELESAKVALEGLTALEQSEWEQLTARFREKRSLPHLRSFPLEYSRIPGVGPADLGTLASRGISTAADITPEALMAVPGIDLALIKGLLLFKDVAMRSFAFDPQTGIPGQQRKSLADSQAKRRERLETTLQTGVVVLAGLRRQILSLREGLTGELDELHRRLAQLRADARQA